MADCDARHLKVFCMATEGWHLFAAGALTLFTALAEPLLRAGLDEGLLSFCLSHSRLYGESLQEEQIVVTNDSAPSCVQAAMVGCIAARDGGVLQGSLSTGLLLTMRGVRHPRR